MRLRVNNEYLEFNADVEVDRKAKLFDELDKVNGDVSFEFQIQLTQHNRKALNFPFPDSSSKTVYRINNADLFNEEGQLISSGYIKPERPVNNTLYCSFWGGNNNWFAMITGNMTDMNLSDYDLDQTPATIVDSWEDTEGIVFPLIDTGALSTRSFANTKVEDFTPTFYVKTLFFEIFQQAGLKLSGELLHDWVYNNLIIASNGRSQDEVNNRSSFVLKNTPQVLTGSQVLVTWDDDFTFPYFDGSQNNFNLSNGYSPDIKMSVQVDLTMNFDLNQDTPPIPATAGIGIYIDGVLRDSFAVFDQNPVFTRSLRYSLNPADDISIQVAAGPASSGTLTMATIKITPIFLYKAFAVAAVPKWTKQQFVSQVLSIFNIIPAYDPYTKTVTFNLFDKLKNKEPIDISEHVRSIETDYVEFISDYAQNNTFNYQETDIDNLAQYNISTFFQYGTGIIPANNDFLEDTKTVLESDFASPISYVNGAFQMSMERIPFVELDEDLSTTISSVSDSSGLAELSISDDIFEVGDLVRITDSNEAYNGDWVVSSVSAGSILCVGLVYTVNATGTVTRMLHSFTTEDNVYLFLNVPDYPLIDAAAVSQFYLDEDLAGSTVAIAYFSLLNQNKPINEQYKQSLSFGPIDNPLFYQRTILDTYWATFSRILNDPVGCKAEVNLPWIVHNKIDFLRPLMVKTLDTTNLYYCTLERGYRNSYTPCELQMIKLP